MDVVFNCGKIASSSGSYFIMDNDSGYVSNNLDQESNSDSVPETLNNSSVDILKSLLPKSIYISEDALLERPDIDNVNDTNADENIQDFTDMPYDELSHIVLNNANTTDNCSFLPSFNSARSDSGSSAYSVVVPVAPPIYYDLNTQVNSYLPISFENDISSNTISSNLSDGPFFGFENVPMESSIQMFPTCSSDIFTTNPVPNSYKLTAFTQFFFNKQNPTTCDAVDSSIPYVTVDLTTPTKRHTIIIDTNTTTNEEGPTCDNNSIKEFTAEKISGSVIKTPSNINKKDIFINIEDLPILIDGYSDLIKIPSEIEESPASVKEEYMSSFLRKNEQNQHTPLNIKTPLNNDQDEESVVLENHQVLPVPHGNIKSCDNVDRIEPNVVCEIQRPENESAAVSRINTPIESENIVLHNVTNNVVCFNNEPSTSKITNPQRNSVENKENLTQPEVFKTPSKCRKRKFSEIGSPDLFSDDESSNAKPAVSPKIMEERFVHKLDQRLINRVQGTIRGVPPPPDLTITKLTVHDILEKLEVNKSYFWTVENMKDIKQESVEKEKASLNGSHNSSFGVSGSILVEGHHEEAINKEFPEILHSRHHGLHHNRSKLSEEIEHLCDKYAKRYIGAETQSTCNALETQYMSPNKRKAPKPKWAVKSPGRRLSHLARRRITFPSGSLQASTSSSSASRARQILIDCKKLELLNRKKSPKKVTRKTPLKSPTVSPSSGRTPSSSAKKKLRMRFRLLSGDLNEMGQRSAASNSKRALFQSPDKDSRFRSMLSSSSSSLNPSFNGDLNTCGAKRSLFPSPNKVKCRTSLFSSPNKKSPFKNQQPFEKKRKRDDDDENISNQAKFFRSQSSSGILEKEPKVDSFLLRTKSESVLMQSQNMTDLSAANKKKLQWAVYESLKLQNITVTHPQFKIFASVLARVTRRCLFSSGVKLEGSGTSEKMLRIAKRYSYAVVKGKSIEEIMSEHNKNRAKVLKPQGYIAPQEYNPFLNKGSSSNKDLAFKDRDSNNGDSVTKSSSSQMAVVKPESRIDRIRKVINFEDNR